MKFDPLYTLLLGIVIIGLVTSGIYSIHQRSSGKTCLECGLRSVWGYCRYCKKWSE